MERDGFVPLDESYSGMPQNLDFVNGNGQRVSVVFGMEHDLPATRFSILDQEDRVISKGGSFAINFGHALTTGLGLETGSRAIRFLRENKLADLGPLATAVFSGVDNSGGRV